MHAGTFVHLEVVPHQDDLLDRSRHAVQWLLNILDSPLSYVCCLLRHNWQTAMWSSRKKATKMEKFC